MTLDNLGYDPKLEAHRVAHDLRDFDIGRVISEHKERYIVSTGSTEFDAEIMGNLRFTAQSRSDFPAVGDWVAITAYDDEKALIHAVYPRTTVLERQAVGKHGEKQIIAANIDYAFIVQAVDRDFSINRIERYLTICNAAGVVPIILLNKVDLVSDDSLARMQSQIEGRIESIPVIPISNETLRGLREVSEMIQSGKTYCLLGSSGVGKSTLLNTLTRSEHMKTGSIGAGTNRGRHVTSHRELVVLETGGIIIDNPGMREVGITDSGVGFETTFSAISELSDQCRFKDCTHTSEVGCAVIQAVTNGEIDEDSYQNFLRLEREKEHFESTVAERRKKDKAFGKMVRDVMKHKKKGRE